MSAVLQEEAFRRKQQVCRVVGVYRTWLRKFVEFRHIVKTIIVMSQLRLFPLSRIVALCILLAGAGPSLAQTGQFLDHGGRLTGIRPVSDAYFAGS